MPTKLTTTTVELNGSTYTLCYDWEAQILAEKITGLNMLSPDGTPSAVVQAMLFARLLKHHPSITLMDVGALLPGNVPRVAEALNKIGDYQDSSPLPISGDSADLDSESVTTSSEAA